MQKTKGPYFFEIKTQLKLAIPAFFAQIAMTSMGLVDMVMTGRIKNIEGQEAVDMASVALAGSLWMPLLLFSQAIIAIIPSISQLFATRENDKIAHIFRQGIWLAVFLTVPFMLIIFSISFQLENLGVEPLMAEIAGRYLRAILWGAPGFLFFCVFRSAFEGMAFMRPAMITSFLGLMINIPLNTIFIFGYFGAPALGGVGTGVATAIVYCFMGASMIFYARRLPETKDAIAFSSWTGPDFKTIKRIIFIGFPGALALLFEVSLFAGVALLLAPLGSVVVAGHQIALNFSSLIFMLPLSIGMAATIRTSYGLGNHDPKQVHYATRSSLLIAMSTALITVTLTLLLRHQIPLFYNDSIKVVTLASSLLLFSAIYQFTDAIQVVSLATLRGYNDTIFVGLIAFFSYFICALPIGFILARTDLLVPALGATGFWIAFILGVTISATLALLRIRILEKRIKNNPDDFRKI